MAEGFIHISVVRTDGPGHFECVQLLLPSGATVAAALEGSGWGDQVDAAAGVGVWGRRAALHGVLQDRDRVELYRALTVDPKLARRERFHQQGVRGAGLFSRQRLGAKAGY